MAICAVKSISQEELLKVYKFVNGFLFEELAAGRPYNMDLVKNMSLRLYNNILSILGENENAKVQAANYASTVPSVVNDVINTFIDAQSGKKTRFNHARSTPGFFGDITELIGSLDDLSSAERVKAVEDWLGIGSGVKDEILNAQRQADELAEKQKKEGNAPGVVASAPAGPVIIESVDKSQLTTEGSDFIAVPPVAIKSSGNELEYDTFTKSKSPNKVFYFKVVRFLQKLIQSTPENDSRNAVSDAANGIHIRFLSAKQIISMGLGDTTIDDGTYFYAVPTSSDGQPLYFDKETGTISASTENASPIAFNIPRISYNKETNRYSFDRRDSEKYMERVLNSRVNHFKISRKEAEEALQMEMGYIHAALQMLIENPNSTSIAGYINGGSPGYTLFEKSIRTPLATIRFAQGPRSYTISIDTTNAYGKGNGRAFLFTDEVPNQPFQLWIPKINDEALLETLATLFTAPIVNSKTGLPITSLERRDMIDQFVNRLDPNLANKVKMYWTDDKLPGFDLAINGQKVSIATEEEIKKVKEQIKDIIRNNIYLRITQDNAKTMSYDPVQLSKSTGPFYLYTPSSSSYYRFLEDIGVYINYELMDDGSLAKYNPYLTFGIDVDQMNSLAPYMTRSNVLYSKVEQRPEEKVVKKSLSARFKAAFIYATPGTGKTVSIGMNEDLVDLDDLLAQEIAKVKGNTTFNVPYSTVTNETVGVYMESLFNTNPDEANLIYEDVLDEVDNLKKKGKTILTGSHRFAEIADYAFVNNNMEDLASSLYQKRKDVGGAFIRSVNAILATQNRIAGKETTIDIANKFMSDVLFEETPAAAAPFTEGNEEALKMLEELGEANFNKIMANHPELGTYDTKDVDELIAEPTDDVSWNVKNEALIDYLNSEDITYQRIKSMLAKQDAYGQSGIELFDQDYNHVRSITFKELMDLIMDDIAQVKPEVAYKNLQQIPFTYDTPSSAIPQVLDNGLDPSDFETFNKLLQQKGMEIKATAEQIKAAEEWYRNTPLSKFLPFQVIFKAINSNPSVIAQWTRNGIILTQGADFTDYYHEAFHGFVATFMTEMQKKQLFNAASSLQGTFIDYDGQRAAFSTATRKQLEEWLAEGFRNYMLDPVKNKPKDKEISSIFDWLRNILRILFEDVTWDMINQDTADASQLIFDLYEKLRVGDLTGYSFQSENTVFDRTPSGMMSLDENDNVNKLNFATTYMISRSMDAIISEYGDIYPLLKNRLIDVPTLNMFNNIRDRKYSGQTVFTEQETALWERVNGLIKGLRDKDGGFSIGMIQNKSFRSKLYKYVRARFIDKANLYSLQLRGLSLDNTMGRAEIQKKLDMVMWTIRNYGDFDFVESNVLTDSFGNIRGVIGYHMMHTDLFDRSDKEALLDNSDINEDDIYVAMASGGRMFDEGGNNMSVLDRADNDIVFILHSLYEPLSDTEKTYIPKINELGFPELMPFDRVWNNAVRLLEGMDDKIDMYMLLKKEIPNFPAYGQLLAKLGSPQIGKEVREQQPGVAPLFEQSTEYNMQGFLMWNKFFQTFGNNFHIPLIQTTIHETYEIMDGVKAGVAKYTVTSGTASAVFKRVGERWESDFQEAIPAPSNYIARTAENANLVDVRTAVINTPELYVNSLPDKFVSFLNSIGVNLSGNAGIISAIKKNEAIRKDIIAIQKKLKSIDDYNRNEKNKDKIVISGPSSLMNVERPGSVGIERLSGVYTRLQELESQYSDYHSNFMVTNAEAQQQYEHSMNSTITRIVNILNDAVKYPNFKDVIALPKMAYLSPSSNYWTEISVMLNSLFTLQDEKGNALDTSDPRYGVRRKFALTRENVKIELNNLSGVALMQDEQWKSGLANASTDVLSKLLSEIHNFANLQVFEMMRHSDKKFSFAGGTDYVYVNGRMQKTYVSFDDFKVGMGFENAARIIKGHMSAEMRRMNLFKSVDEKGLIYDFKYLDRGKDFVIFKDMPVDLERELLKLSPDKTLMEHLREDNNLDQRVTEYITQWLSRLSDSLDETIGSNGFFDMPAKVNLSRKQLLQAFITNNVIHNLETLVLIYGDPAMYTLEKEEFHKRNSGAGGTGKMTPTDRSTINFINSSSFEKDAYARAKLGAQNINTRLFDGTLDTAVIKDPILKSAYYDQIAEYEKTRLEKMNKTPEQINEILYGKDGTHDAPTGGKMKPYKEMKVADAQGYISFDAYRMMRASQGRWSDLQEKLYKRIVNGDSINEKELREIFPPEKYQYWGHMKMPNSMPSVIAMHKFALIPLIPTMIKGNSTLTALHDKMMREGIHYATFKSGSKIGTLTTGRQQDRVFEDDQSMKLAPEFETKPFTKNTIFVEYLKVQVEIAPNFKNNISFMSQLRKLIEDGFMGDGGIPADFGQDIQDLVEREKAWKKLTEDQKLKASGKYRMFKTYEDDLKDLAKFKKEELIEEMGVEFDDEGRIKEGIERFIAFVKRELTRKEIGNHTINMIGVNENGELKMPLDLSLEADTIEKILNNILTKRLVKFKVKGEGFMQVSNAFFENRDFALSDATRSFKKPTDEEREKYGSIDLPYYRLGVDKEGNPYVKLAKCKIAISGDFLNLLYSKDKEGNQITVYKTELVDGKRTRVMDKTATLEKLNSLLKDEEWLDMGDNRMMVTIGGARIPVQGMNSAEAMEVYEFLPEESGPIIIVPAEMVAKSGSDFDKDTIYMMTPHIYRVNGKVKLIKSNVRTEYDKNTLNERLREVKERKSRLLEELYKSKDSTENLLAKLSPEEFAAFKIINDEYTENKLELQARIARLQSALLKYRKGKIRLSGREAIDMDNLLYNAFVDLDVLENTYRKNRDMYLGVFKDAQIDPLDELIERYTEQRHSLTSKASENAIIGDFARIIGDADNYSSLVTPNDTNIVKPVADDLQKFLDVKDGKTWMFRDDISGIAATRILEIEYNLYKHESNNVGKQVLGIGAVDNTYNILYNRIGMYMNPYAAMGITQEEAKTIAQKLERGETLTDQERKAMVYRQTIYFDHNKLNKFGMDAISLSHIYDAEGKHKIGDVISQLINGWVDVAKDAWIFNLQGNKEIASTLLFMIQAGVPFEQAAYFVSQPIIRDYVKEQRLAKAPFGRPLGKAPSKPNMFRNKARAAILTNPKYGFDKATDMDIATVNNLYRQKNEILRVADKFIPQMLLETTTDGQFSFEQLKKGLEKGAKTDQHQRAAFLHFLQLEEMAKASTELKMATNVDTARTNTMFTAVEKIIKMMKLEESYRLPGREMLSKLRKESPISSFFVQELQLEIGANLFSIRNSKSLIEFIKKNMNKLRSDLEDTYGEGNEEEFWQSFRNNMVSFIFQSVAYDFDPRKMTSYKGMGMEKSAEVVKTPALFQRVSVKTKDGKSTIYVDIDAIESDFTSNNYAEPGKLRASKDAVPYAALSRSTFDPLTSFQTTNDISDESYDPFERRSPNVTSSKETLNEEQYRMNQAKRNMYIRFVIEREITRSQIPLSKAKELYEYQVVLRETPVLVPNREMVAYEEFLKNRALDNIYNPYKMYVAPVFNVADTLFRLKKDFPQLTKDYAVFDALTKDQDRKSDEGLKNLRLRNTRLTSTQINVYKENLSDLADPLVEKVPNKEANLFISRFFSKLTIYGYMQAGLNSGGRYSLNKILAPEAFTTFMVRYIREYGNYLDQQKSNLSFYDLYYPAFVSTESYSGKRYAGGARVKVYGSPFSMEYLNKLDKRPDDYLMKVVEKKIKQDVILPAAARQTAFVYNNDFGLPLFRRGIDIPGQFTTNSMESYIMYYNQLDSTVGDNPSSGQVLFVHNKLVNTDYIAQASPGDWLFDHPSVRTTRKIGIPTVKWDQGKRAMVDYKDSVKDGVAVPNEELKPLIDQAIDEMVKLKGSRMLIFNNMGYGTELQLSAPVTYLYLSEKLARNFGYVNPGIKANPNSVQVYEALDDYYTTGITYSEAAELYQKCLT